jgi:hypothetical protein
MQGRLYSPRGKAKGDSAVPSGYFTLAFCDKPNLLIPGPKTPWHDHCAHAFRSGLALQSRKQDVKPVWAA